ncbi:hypothetical protein PMAYCL1PPCAC_14530 [Pristionchus mayeri]|uniref:Uncharacterized protein n=1 Tax=Pristionchus mayeri TaxID=1317129 RepID=A0AAN4ZUP2_9BILA|nr:hypothetical protein PMAYCL1PPCAC_14530 [Pristionchus mayeri]
MAMTGEPNTRKRRKESSGDVSTNEEAELEQAILSSMAEAEPGPPSAEMLELRQLLYSMKQSLTLEQQLNHSAQMVPNSDLKAAKREEECQRKEKDLKKKVIDVTIQLGKEMKRARKREADLTKQLEKERDEGMRAKEQCVLTVPASPRRQ